jgi:hypothetical protein
MNNTIPATDGVGFKSLQSYHGAVTDAETGDQLETETQRFQVITRFGKELHKIDVANAEELKSEVEKQWKLRPNQYFIHPKFDVQKAGTDYIITLKVNRGNLNPMQDLRPRFGYWYKEDRGSQFCRFWYRDQVCDAYLEDWTTHALIAQILTEDPEADPELKVWRKGELLEGPFDWEDIGLSVSKDPPEEDEYPELWRWEVEIDAMAETVLMRISPVHPLADVLRGVEYIWGVEHFHEWVVWGPAGPMVEAECRDGMTVRVRDRGEGLGPSEAKVLVHCEGQELIVTAQTWLQLRCRLNDIARMGSGLKDFHVYDERNCTGFSNGEEIWTYWTTGLTQWRQWERAGPDPRPKQTVVIDMDDTWYMISKTDLKDAPEFPNLMHSEMAKRLHVPLEELR